MYAHLLLSKFSKITSKFVHEGVIHTSFRICLRVFCKFGATRRAAADFVKERWQKFHGYESLSDSFFPCSLTKSLTLQIWPRRMVDPRGRVQNLSKDKIGGFSITKHYDALFCKTSHSPRDNQGRYNHFNPAKRECIAHNGCCCKIHVIKCNP